MINPKHKISNPGHIRGIIGNEFQLCRFFGFWSFGIA